MKIVRISLFFMLVGVFFLSFPTLKQKSMEMRGQPQATPTPEVAKSPAKKKKGKCKAGAEALEAARDQACFVKPVNNDNCIAAFVKLEDWILHCKEDKETDADPQQPQQSAPCELDEPESPHNKDSFNRDYIEQFAMQIFARDNPSLSFDMKVMIVAHAWAETVGEMRDSSGAYRPLSGNNNFNLQYLNDHPADRKALREFKERGITIKEVKRSECLRIPKKDYAEYGIDPEDLKKQKEKRVSPIAHKPGEYCRAVTITVLVPEFPSEAEGIDAYFTRLRERFKGLYNALSDADASPQRVYENIGSFGSDSKYVQKYKEAVREFTGRLERYSEDKVKALDTALACAAANPDSDPATTAKWKTQKQLFTELKNAATRIKKTAP